jgi:hypothetical protein
MVLGWTAQHRLTFRHVLGVWRARQQQQQQHYHHHQDEPQVEE